MEYLPLKSGHSIPQMGLGTWSCKPGEVQKAVDVAVDTGYRHFDCAHLYANQKEIGFALKRIFDAGKVLLSAHDGLVLCTYIRTVRCGIVALITDTQSK